MAKKKKAAKKKVTKKAAKKVTKKASEKVTKKATPAATVNKASMNDVAKNVSRPRTKSDVYNILAACSGLSKKDVGAVFENLQQLIDLDLGKKGPGVFNFPGLMKIVKIKKPATKQRKGVNPFTKEPMIFKAKPARNVVKVRALKGLKEMVS